MAAADVGDEPPASSLATTPSSAGSHSATSDVAVADAERPLGAVPEAVVVLVPADALAVHEPLGQALARRDGGVRGLERAGHQERARLVGEDERVLGRQDVGRRLGVIDDEAARRLGVEPLAHVALLGAGPRGELRRHDGLAVGHRLVEAELVAERHEGGVERGAQLGGRVADEGLELLLVDVGDRHDQGATQRS